jgi:uncharacterized protein involved in type VI secretion and phage assembly
MSQRHNTHTEPDNAIPGVRVAIVRDNEDPENLGRVKLEFPWRDADDESYWARIATEMTGDGYGTHFLPEVEDEVLVSFENGDIHSPIVIGSLYSGDRKPANNNADGNNDIRAITTRSGHKIEFDDNDQSGAVTVKTNAGHEVVLDDESGGEAITIEDKAGNSIEMDAVGNSITLDAKKEISLEAPTIKLSADAEVSIDGGTSVDVSGATVDVSGGMLNVGSDGNMTLDANGMMIINGAIIQLN